MPWDEKNVRVFDAQKSSPKITPHAFRSAVYKRAIALLQSEDSDATERGATAASLYRVLANAQRHARSSREQPSDQLPSNLKQQHHRSSKEQDKQDRRQRYEQEKRDKQQKHQERLQLRQQEAAQRKLQAEEQDQKMQQLHDRQKALETQLKQHRQKCAEQAAFSKATEQPDAVQDLQQSLQKLQQQKVKAEQQLAMVIQAGEQMSRRAASIEPEDGECTPSPSAAQQQAQASARQHGTVPSQDITAAAAQALPPPPPVNMRPGSQTASKDLPGQLPAAPSMPGKADLQAGHLADDALPPPPPWH